MPRLVLFAGCEKAVVDQLSHALSLMSLLQEVTVSLLPGAGIPPSNSVVPMQWAAVVMFRKLATDTGKTFEQRCEVLDSSGRKLMETAVAVFEMKSDSHNIVNQVMGMPIGEAGLKSIKCLIREKGQGEWIEVGDYPIEVKWRTVQ